MSSFVNESKPFMAAEPKYCFAEMRNTRLLGGQQSTINFFVPQDFLSLPLFPGEQLMTTGNVTRLAGDAQLWGDSDLSGPAFSQVCPYGSAGLSIYISIRKGYVSL